MCGSVHWCTLLQRDVRGDISAARASGECRFQTTHFKGSQPHVPHPKAQVSLSYPGAESKAGPSFAFSPGEEGVLVFCLFSENYLWGPNVCVSPWVSPCSSSPGPTGSKGPQASVPPPPLPHHKSLPINAPVSEGGAGAMLGKAWAGLCAL